MPGEKTEKATPKKRQEERKKGHIPQSQDIVTAASMLSLFLVLKAMGGTIGSRITAGMRQLLGGMPNYIAGPDDMKSRLLQVFLVFLQVLLPIALISAAVNIAATFAQTRLLVTASQLKPKIGRISPLQGFKRMFSVRSLVELLKSLLKIAVIALVIYFEIRPQIGKVLLLFDTSLGAAFSWITRTTLDIGFKASMAMLIIGAGDYFYQWWNYEKDMRMSKEEIKDEFKQLEGNPEIKGRIRSLQRRMARMRMMQAVPTADAVIRNPTHFAVAIKYNAENRKAPVVVAKGRDLVALKIVEIAEKNKVYITENRPLAQALFKTVEIGDEIPAEFYKAVAEVLAYIYRLRRAGRL